jgi:hypothetical protein
VIGFHLSLFRSARSKVLGDRVRIKKLAEFSSAAVQACRGTAGSNPPLCSGGSGELRRLLCRSILTFGIETLAQG